MRKSVEINLTDKEHTQLEAVVGSARSEVRNMFRAKIILLADKGKTNKTIASIMNTSRQTVSLWRNRFARLRLEGLNEIKGRGRKRTYDAKKVETIVEKTLTATPSNATHWSTRAMAKESGVSHMTVCRIWNIHQLKPHLIKTFKISNDKNFTDKLKDVIGLYLNPPEHALVLCVDEKSQIQALDRTQPSLPIKKGRCATMTHDYKRYGTTSLFAALNMLDGTVIGECMKRHRHQEYLKFLKKIDRETPANLDLHLIVDNYSTHKHKDVKKWMENNPRFYFHYIPTSCSWLNLVERFFSEITSKRIRRGIFKSVAQLTQAIYDYLKFHNTDPKPFVWTKTADEILNKIAPLYKINNK